MMMELVSVGEEDEGDDGDDVVVRGITACSKARKRTWKVKGQARAPGSRHRKEESWN